MHIDQTNVVPSSPPPPQSNVVKKAKTTLPWHKLNIELGSGSLRRQHDLTKKYPIPAISGLGDVEHIYYLTNR
jgi:hypothetical protein